MIEPLRAALAKAPEAERYRLLGALLDELANQAAARGDGGGAEQLEAVTKKLNRANEQKALLEDTLATAKADLEHRAKQLEAESQRGKEFERIANDQRSRLQALQTQVTELEEQIVAKNNRLHQAESQVEALTIRLQRADVAARDTSRVDTLEEGKRGLAVEVERLRQDLEQLRRDKDAEIERLKSELTGARSSAGPASDKVLADLWDRLARAKPPLAAAAQTPGVPAAERLVDAFIELTRFVQDLDQSLAPFLTGFTKHNPAVARPWEVYAKSPELQQLVREIVDVEHGKPAGVLKMRLMGLKRWVIAAIIGSDSAIESIAQELETQLRGEVGMGSDPNRKVKDYIRDDGHQLFHQHIRELRSQKLGDAYAHGV